MSRVKALLQSLLKTLLGYLSESQRLKFNKIHKPLDEMSKTKLIEAIELVERTLDNNDIQPIRVLEDSIDKISIDDDGGYRVW